MSNIYLTSTAADAAVTVGSGTKWKAAMSAGSSARLCNRNGSSNTPLQLTDSATAGTNGTVVSWYTDPLNAVTIAGAVTVSLWTKISATSANMAPCVRIERTDGSGNILSTIIAQTVNQGAGEMSTTANGSSDTISLSAAQITDTTLSTGDRLRITLWVDDSASQGGNGADAIMSGNAQMWVNGPTGSQGQAQFAFTESLTVVSTGTNVNSESVAYTVAGQDATSAVGLNAEVVAFTIASQDTKITATTASDSAALAVTAQNATVVTNVAASAENTAVSVTGQNASVSTAVNVAAESASLAIAGQNATAMAVAATSANAEVATVSIVTENASVTTVAVTTANAEVASFTVAANDTTSAVIANPEDVAVGLVATDAGQAVVTSVDTASVTVTAQNATTSEVAETDAPADVAPAEVSGQDAAVHMASSVDIASLSLAGMDVSTTVTGTAEAASAAFAAEDPQAAVAPLVDTATVGMVAENPTILTGTVIHAGAAELALEAQDAEALTQGSTSVFAEAATFTVTSESIASELQAKAEDASFAVTGWDPVSRIVLIVETASLALQAYGVSYQEHFGSMNTGEGSAAVIDLLPVEQTSMNRPTSIPTVSVKFKETVMPSMGATEQPMPHMDGGT